MYRIQKCVWNLIQHVVYTLQYASHCPLVDSAQEIVEYVNVLYQMETIKYTSSTVLEQLLIILMVKSLFSYDPLLLCPLVKDDKNGFIAFYVNGTNTTTCPDHTSVMVTFTCDADAKWNFATGNVTEYVVPLAGTIDPCQVT